MSQYFAHTSLLSGNIKVNSIMVRDIKIETKRMHNKPRLGLRPRFPCGLTNPPDHYMLESECIWPS